MKGHIFITFFVAMFLLVGTTMTTTTTADCPGGWRWVEDGSLVDDGSGSFTNWYEPTDQPNGGESQNCMWMSSYNDGRWYDTDCDNTFYAVCSKPIASSAAAAHNIERT